MFVVSVSSKNVKKFIFILVCVCVATAIAFSVSSSLKRTSNTPVNTACSTDANSSEEILKFISQYGWKTDTEPTEIRDVIIPEEFDDVYNNYNDIQLSQGFDLTRYAGKRVKRRTYIIRNYPGYSPDDDFIRINILISDGNVIGGDVCSIKLDGFMHGFKLEDV